MTKVYSKIIIAFILISFLIPSSSWAETPELFKHIGNDFKYSFAKWPVAILLGGSVVAGGLYFEDQVMQNNYGSKKLGKFDKAMDILGEFYTVDTASFAVFLTGKAIHNEKVAITGEALLEGLIITQVTTAGLKVATNRTRPNGKSFSFPSNHASSTFCIASVLEAMHGPKFGIPAYLIASLISFTKFDSKSHYTSDLIFGAALGSTIGFGTGLFHKYKLDNVHITPMAGTTNGIMISVDF